MSYLDAYSTEKLTQDLASKWPGRRNAAHYLLELDTPERRARASAEGHTLMNLLGFRYSEGVADAVRSLKRMIESGAENEELYGEKTARMEREREQAYREARQ